MAVVATDSTDVSEGPVLNFINKRLRALRKKQNRILQIEESLGQGKSINKEQEDLIRSKISISSSIDELERLRQPLAAAVAEEITLSLQRHQESASPSDTTADPLDAKEDDKENEQETADAEPQQDREDSIVEDLLNLLYFGVMFDVKSQNDFTSMMFTRTHERGCCLTYDYVTDDESADLLGEMDLDLISRLSGLLISRPTDSVLSHKNALQRCAENAKLWLANSNQPIDSIPSTTYAGLRTKLNKIMASHYFTTTPEMKATVVMAAAAAGNYGSFQVAARQESIVSLDVPIHVESPDEQYQEEDDSSNFQGNEAYNYESNPVEESQKEECDAGEVQTKEELIRSETDDQNQNGGESKEEQQYTQRRSNQNQRGGGRSGGRRVGYSSGRGGRGSGRGGGASYQNGRNQFNDDQSGNYYPRSYYYNNNNRGRGGRGGGAGGGGGPYNSSSSHGSAGAPP